MAAVLGISGATRDACAAICIDGQVLAACEQERLTRVRGIGLTAGALPDAAVDEVIARAKRRRADIDSYR